MEDNALAQRARIVPYRLKFKRPAGTSRGVLHVKDTWFLVVEKDGRRGIGEIAMFRGLSAEDGPAFERNLKELEQTVVLLPYEALREHFEDYSSILFGIEQAALSLAAEDDPMLLFPSDFTAGRARIPINGLVWMGDKEFMRRQIDEKISRGFRVIKLKIGALDFETELELLAYIRQQYGNDIEIRTDANGAFSPEEALEKLERLAEWNIHSIEQPIRAGQWEEMARLCSLSPVPIALDEELIGRHRTDKRRFLETIRPAYIILKPSLHGGLEAADQWIQAARQTGTGWWITSALESNIGLNALAQYTYRLGVERPQGLGTGSLFTNNIPSPLYLEGDSLGYNPRRQWQIPFL